ncbi:MAG TPA: hypothetical protein VHW09_21175 [Bryobacteraceae bacterium]|jgi:4-amino-4-deoxy-L-arabinose transferase-like glycosyltransferase|nr:hypothetical protein [Bryobacteraceae bacterium]
MIASVRSRRWVVAVWACFLVRLLFYSSVLPLWEGYDEWAHFAVVRQMVFGGHWLGARDAPVPRDVEASLELAPVPWELRSLAAPAMTEDRYWRLPAEERARRGTALRTMPASWSSQDGSGALLAYEALQPPLYYWLMAPVLWIFRGGGLLSQVLALRFCSVALASLAVPLVYRIAVAVWGEGGAALGTASVVALMPGLVLDVARVGNDCLAVALFTLLTWLLLRGGRGWAIGTVLGLGLLTKAYFLTAIPAIAVVWWITRRRAVEFLRLVAAAAVLAGWWYVRNLLTTGTLSGLSESVMLRGTGAFELVRRSAEIDWLKAIDSIFLSHLYFGGWSSLTVRSWMYHLFYAAIAAAAVGLVRAVRISSTRVLLAVYGFFWLGQFYNVVILYISKGLAGSMGWYMYAVVGAEVTLCIVGLRALAPRAAPWIPLAGAAMFALLDLYTVHAVAIPYYTGMLRHRANGSLEALHAVGLRSVGIGGAVDRLAVFVPPALLVGLWLLYLAGTAGALACAGARKCDSAAKS